MVPVLIWFQTGVAPVQTEIILKDGATMAHTKTLGELFKSLIILRNKAEHAYICVTVLDRGERKLVKKQIDSCMQSLHFLSEHLDQTECGKVAPGEQNVPSAPI